MILVVVGSSQFPFDRLLRAVDSLPSDEPMVVQHGASAIRPRAARCTPYFSFEELAHLVRSAHAVVTHAGVGSILLSLTNGKRPFVVPRLRAFGETVDDHQVESARRFAAAGLVTLVEDASRLRDALVNRGETAIEPPAGGGRLARELRNYLADMIVPARQEVVP